MQKRNKKRCISSAFLIQKQTEIFLLLKEEIHLSQNFGFQIQKHNTHILYPYIKKQLPCGSHFLIVAEALLPLNVYLKVIKAPKIIK